MRIGDYEGVSDGLGSKRRGGDTGLGARSGHL